MIFKTFIRSIIPSISDADLKIFFSKARKTTFEKGELFVKEGEICCDLLFIQQGLFRYYLLHEGHDITKDFALDNQNPCCTAYTSFMLQKPSEIWIEALETSIVWSWKRLEVLLLFQDHPEWLRFSKAMVDRMFFRKEQKEIDLLKCSAEARYRRFLHDFPGLSQRVPQYHIASYIGIQPESLSRIRSRIAKGS